VGLRSKCGKGNIPLRVLQTQLAFILANIGSQYPKMSKEIQSGYIIRINLPAAQFPNAMPTDTIFETYKK
jgi:hypothetical protein